MTTILATGTTVAREYLRVSADRSGRMVSTTDQHSDHKAVADERGWTLAEPYEEAGAMSASRYGHKVRDGFAGLVEDLEAGRFNANVLVMWEASRGSRKSWEWARLIEALMSAGVRVFITSEDREYDCAVARDRKSLRDSASDSEYESDKISGRVGRGMRKVAEAGAPHGRVVYGYTRVYRVLSAKDEELQPGEYRLRSDDLKVARQVPHPDEAPAVRLIFASLKAGESLRSIARALAGEGPQPAMGEALRAAAERYAGTGAPGRWDPTRVRDVALNPAYAGQRIHIAGHRSGRQPEFQQADLTPGTWPALVPFDDFMDVVRKLRKPSRSTATGRGRTAQHLLSMVAVCGRCGGPMSVRYTHKSGRPSYTCRDKGCVTTDRDDLDAYVVHAVLALLSDPAAYARLAPRASSADLDAARAELAGVRAEHADLAANVAAGRLSATLAAASEPGILARLETAAARVRELEAPAGVAALGLAPGADIAQRWAAAPLSARRAVVRTLFASVTVKPAGRGYSGPVEDRTEIIRNG